MTYKANEKKILSKLHKDPWWRRLKLCILDSNTGLLS